MSTATSIGALGQQGEQNPYSDALREVGIDDFLKMMITELQNQDPLNPMDNTQILQQIGQIREIVSNDQLTETLDAVFLGQNLTAASSLMGEWVAAIDDDNSVMAAGQVEQVSIENGIPKLVVGGRILKLGDVTQIQSEDDARALSEAMDLMNKQISGTTEATNGQLSREITGWVTRVSMSALGVPKLHVKTDLADQEGIEFTIDPEEEIEILTPGVYPNDQT